MLTLGAGSASSDNTAGGSGGGIDSSGTLAVTEQRRLWQQGQGQWRRDLQLRRARGHRQHPLGQLGGLSGGGGIYNSRGGASITGSTFLAKLGRHRRRRYLHKCGRTDHHRLHHFLTTCPRRRRHLRPGLEHTDAHRQHHREEYGRLLRRRHLQRRHRDTHEQHLRGQLGGVLALPGGVRRRRLRRWRWSDGRQLHHRR